MTLVIVAWDQQPLYEYLRWGFSTTAGVGVILDRRRWQRRKLAGSPEGPGRRVSSRRRQGVVSAEVRTRGFAIARSAEAHGPPAGAARFTLDESAGPEPAPPPQPAASWLTIVRPDRYDVMSGLQELFGEHGLFRPIWDRRLADRRAEARPVPTDRRRAERRRTPARIWTTLGFVVVRSGADPSSSAPPALPHDRLPTPAEAHVDRARPGADRAPVYPEAGDVVGVRTAVLVSRHDLERNYACRPVLDVRLSWAWRCGFCNTGVITPVEEDAFPEVGSTCPYCQAVVVEVSEPWWYRLRRGLRRVRRALRRRPEGGEDTG